MAPKVKMDPENDAIPNVESQRGSDNFRILFGSVYHLESSVTLQTNVNTVNTANHFKIRVKIPPMLNPTSYTYRKWVKQKLQPEKLRWNLNLTQLKRNIIWSKPPLLTSMLIFHGVAPNKTRKQIETLPLTKLATDSGDKWVH